MFSINETVHLSDDKLDKISLDSDYPDNAYAKGFAEDLSTRICSKNLRSALGKREDAIKPAVIYAGKLINDQALGLAGYAHVAEQLSDGVLRPNIAKSLKHEFPENSREIADDKRYALGILLDIGKVRQETRDMLATSKDVTKPVLDPEFLTELANTTNLESIIISASAHHSEFLELSAKRSQSDNWSGVDEKRMTHLANTIRSVDAILLELTGFDAFASNALSPVYIWDLENRGRQRSVEQAQSVIADLGGYSKIAEATDDFLKELFSDHAIDEVTSSQDEGRLRFTDGVANISSDGEEMLTRVLTRLKSTGALAQKIDNTKDQKPPLDIIGISLVVDDASEVAAVTRAALANIESAGASLVPAPTRDELIHVKGSREFIDSIEQGVEFENKTWQQEEANNGYEAVKITMMYEYQETKYPIEIQITHDAARKSSRHGLASHTVFKLGKLFGVKLTQEELESIAAKLASINGRKEMLDKSRLHLCDESNQRVDIFLNHAKPSFGAQRALGREACLQVIDSLPQTDK